MITEQDLQAAIAECKGVKSPNANTCIKLAAFYIIKEHLYPDEMKMPIQEYSYDPPPDDPVIDINSDSEFAQAVNGRLMKEIMPIVDEAMDALQVLNPAFYASIIRKLNYN